MGIMVLGHLAILVLELNKLILLPVLKPAGTLENSVDSDQELQNMAADLGPYHLLMPVFCPNTYA